MAAKPKEIIDAIIEFSPNLVLIGSLNGEINFWAKNFKTAFDKLGFCDIKIFIGGNIGYGDLEQKNKNIFETWLSCSFWPVTISKLCSPQSKWNFKMFLFNDDIFGAMRSNLFQEKYLSLNEKDLAAKRINESNYNLFISESYEDKNELLIQPRGGVDP